MSLSNHVSISISQDTVTVPRLGFGKALLLSYSASWAERVRTYSSLAGVAADFSTTTSPEYLAAAAYFGQNPRPSTLKIGRGANAPTLAYTITPTAANSTIYSITVRGEGVTTTTVTYTSDASATVAEICAGLETALNGVTGANFTATDNTTNVDVTGDAAGDWFTLEVSQFSLLDIAVDHADPGVAADLNAIQAEDDDWYCLLTNYNSDACVKAADAWIAAQKKIYIFDSPETEAATTAAGNGELFDDLKDLARARTAPIWHPYTGDMMAAASAGKNLPQDPGSITWKFKTLSGVQPVTLTDTHKTNLRARNANFYVTVGGNNIMTDGTTADGDFIDVQRGIDWIENEVQTEVFANLLGPGKIPYTNAGVTVITSAIKAVLARAVERDVLAADPAPAVVAPDVADISASIKATRVLPDVQFSGTLAGAIHKVNITGVVSA